MTTKEKVVLAVEALPDDATIEDAVERLLFLAKIERGVRQADAGESIPHSMVKERMVTIWHGSRLLDPSRLT
jgi:predicted transcriptional regulator